MWHVLPMRVLKVDRNVSWFNCQIGNHIEEGCLAESDNKFAIMMSEAVGRVRYVLLCRGHWPL